jgi:hypothetical protein
MHTPEFGDHLLYPRGVLVEYILLSARCPRDILDAGADQCPTGLIVVRLQVFILNI